MALVTRVLVLWLGRPEFVGWFNHTYYYYVETKGLLLYGKLPFPDMPLLFYLYAVTGKILTWFGIELNQSIVISTRFWMSIIPSLLPIPIYLTLKSIFNNQVLPKWTWVFLITSAFYPLTILYLPEFLQKNTLGLLLLAFFIWQSKLALNKLNSKRIFVLSILFLLITLTHFGTVAVTLLLTTSILLSYFVLHPKKITFKIIFAPVAGLVIALTAFYLLDIQRFYRIGHYIHRIYDSSSLALLFSPNDPDKFTTIFMIVVPLILLLLLLKWYQYARKELSKDNSLFWLSNTIFIYLLILPIYEPLLLARFFNFVSLPFIFILVYLIRFSVKKSWIKTMVLSVVFLGTLTIAFGDIVSSFWHNKNKEEVYQDLMKMKNEIHFTDKDLVITRNGAEHISNWFLNTKSCMVTSFNTNDFKKYNRIYILNPTEGNMRLQEATNDETQKYNYMLSNIQVPANADEIYKSEHIELYKIEKTPNGWVFDKNGYWTGYEE